MRTLSHVALAFPILRLIFPRASKERQHSITAWWCRKLLRILHVELVAEGTPPPWGSAVMMAPNHISWLDTFALSAVRPTRFIAKSEIRDWPIAGWVAQRSGTLFIRRHKRHDTGRINELVHAALAAGDCVGFFPEGTTTEGDTLHKFHSSLFEPAVANRATVQPVAIRYEHVDGTLCRAMSFVGDLSFAQSLGLVIRQKQSVVRIRFATPIDPHGLTRRDVAKVARERVATLLGLPAQDTAPSTPPGP